MFSVVIHSLGGKCETVDNDNNNNSNDERSSSKNNSSVDKAPETSVNKIARGFILEQSYLSRPYFFAKMDMYFAIKTLLDKAYETWINVTPVGLSSVDPSTSISGSFIADEDTVNDVSDGNIQVVFNTGPPSTEYSHDDHNLDEDPMYQDVYYYSNKNQSTASNASRSPRYSSQLKKHVSRDDNEFESNFEFVGQQSKLPGLGDDVQAMRGQPSSVLPSVRYDTPPEHGAQEHRSSEHETRPHHRTNVTPEDIRHISSTLKRKRDDTNDEGVSLDLGISPHQTHACNQGLIKSCEAVDATATATASGEFADDFDFDLNVVDHTASLQQNGNNKRAKME